MAQASATVKFYAYISGAWTLLDDISPARGSWGGGNEEFDYLANVGDIRLSLNNSTGIYSPDSPSALAGWKKGIPFKMVVTYDSYDYVRFYGSITDIKIKPRHVSNKVDITVSDWLDYASRQPISDLTLLEDATTDSAIAEILGAMPIQPQSSIIDAGVSTYPTVFDSVKEYTKGFSEFGKLALSEPGYIYDKKDIVYGNTLVFESANRRNGQRTLSVVPKTTADSGFLKKEDNGYLLKEDGGKLVLTEYNTAVFDNNMLDFSIEYGENIINRVTAAAYPKRIDTAPAVVYELEKPIPFASGETKIIRGRYTNPNGGNVINALTPEENSTVKAMLHFDGGAGDPPTTDETGKIWTKHDVETITNVVKVGSGAAYFDGSSSWLSSEDSPDWDFGSEDFTVEWYEYRFSAASGACVTARDYSASFGAFVLGKSDGTNSKVYLSSAGASFDIANGKSFGAITLNTWVHYAITREGSTFRLFTDGTLITTWSNSSALAASTAQLTIGRLSSTYITAAIDEFRIVKGEAKYTADFTPSETGLPLTGTFGTMWTGDDSTGTELTSEMTISVAYYTSGAAYTITNGSGSSGYLTTLRTLGYGVYSYSSLSDIQEDTDSINEYGYENANLQQTYQQNTYTGKIEAEKVIYQENQPRTVLKSVKFNANRSSDLMMSFINLDIGDLVNIIIDEAGIDAYYYIHNISFTVKGGGLITYTWDVKEAYTVAKGLTLMAAEFAGGSATDGINFGYLPMVSGDQMTKRIYSAWIYMDSVPTVHDYVIGGAFSDGGGSLFFVDSHATNRLLSYYHNRYNTTPGKWTCPANAFSLSTWTHVLVYHDLSNVNNDPEIYIAGSVQALTENSTPAGTLVSEVGTNLVIGNWKTATNDYTNAFDGKIKDFRVYNADNLTASTIAAGIAAEGAGGTGFIDGLVFQAFAVRTRDLTAYTNLTLTDEKVLDAYLCYVGTPSGSPIMRTV